MEGKGGRIREEGKGAWKGDRNRGQEERREMGRKIREEKGKEEVTRRRKLRRANVEGKGEGRREGEVGGEDRGRKIKKGQRGGDI